MPDVKDQNSQSDVIPADPKPAIQAEDTRRAVSPKMTVEGRARAVELFALGYTVRYVRTALKEDLGRVPTDQELVRIAVEEGDDINRIRQELEEVAFERGIASKAVRMDRLNKLAESLEPAALSGSTKAANTLINTLKQAREETDPLGLQLVLPKNDPWAELLTDLRETAQKRLISSEETPTDKSDQDQTKSVSSSKSSE
jgi:hypothetical protein